MLGKLDQYFQFNETALSLRSKRQEVIASNIANADTPNYKARDIDFASALQTALGTPATSADGTAPALALSTSSSAHLTDGAPAGSTLPDGTPLLYRTPAQGSVDGNTVDMDVERNQFTDNSVRYEAGVTMISAQIKNMLAAIQAAQ